MNPAAIQRLHEIHLLLEDGDRLALRPVGLTPTQVNLLRSVDEAEGGEMTVTQLARTLLCTRGNAARLVRRLGDSDLVATRGDERDQRLVRVSLTPEGRRRLAEARELLDAATERRVAALTPADARALERVSERLVAALRRDVAEQAGAG